VDAGSREENALFKDKTRLSDPSGSENAMKYGVFIIR
jgi:hypothetical protein